MGDSRLSYFEFRSVNDMQSETFSQRYLVRDIQSETYSQSHSVKERLGTRQKYLRRETAMQTVGNMVLEFETGDRPFRQIFCIQNNHL